MPEPLDLDALERDIGRDDICRCGAALALIAELRATRAERDAQISMRETHYAALKHACARAERAEAELAEEARNHLDDIRLLQKAEAAIARVEAVLADPPVPSRMLIAVIRAALRGDDE